MGFTNKSNPTEQPIPLQNEQMNNVAMTNPRSMSNRRVCHVALISSLILLLACNQLVVFQRSLTATADDAVALLPSPSVQDDSSVFAGQSVTSEELIRKEAISRYSPWNTSRLSVPSAASGHQVAGTSATLGDKLRQVLPRNKFSKQALVAAPSDESKAFPAPIKLPFPIFVASLFKSGTTTVHSYFACGGQRSVHWKNANHKSTGQCIQQNILLRQEEANDDPFQGCGDYDVWSDQAVLQPPHNCWDPSIHGLEAIYKAHPLATILLAVRDSDKWLNSVIRWGRLLDKLWRCRDLWPSNKNKKTMNTTRDIRDFYEWHQQHVRSFATLHPSITFVEVDLESNQTASILEERVGISASCWGHFNRNDESLRRTGVPSPKEPLDAST